MDIVECALLGSVRPGGDLRHISLNRRELADDIGGNHALGHGEPRGLIDHRVALNGLVDGLQRQLLHDLQVVGIGARLGVAVDHRRHPLQQRRLLRKRGNAAVFVFAGGNRHDPLRRRGLIADIEHAPADDRVVDHHRRGEARVPAIDRHAYLVGAFGQIAERSRRDIAEEIGWHDNVFAAHMVEQGAHLGGSQHTRLLRLELDGLARHRLSRDNDLER